MVVGRVGSLPQIRALNAWVGHERGGRTRDGDAPGLEDVGTPGELEGLARVPLDEQHGHAVAVGRLIIS
jgi:hypothetical protein